MIIGYINKQSLRIGQNLVVTGTIDYLEAEFHFTNDWTGLQKWAHFTCSDKDFKILLDDDDRITQDKHLNLTTGTWTVWLHGDELHDGEVKQRATTDQQTITVKNTGVAEDGQPFEPMEPSVTEQILALVDKAQGTADKAAEDVTALSEHSDAEDNKINNKIGNLYALNSKNRSNLVAAINDALVTPDYEENDNTALGYIKHRPFYEYKGKYAYNSSWTKEKSTWTSWADGTIFHLNDFDCFLDGASQFIVDINFIKRMPDGGMQVQGIRSQSSPITLSDWYLRGYPQFEQYYGHKCLREAFTDSVNGKHLDYLYFMDNGDVLIENKTGYDEMEFSYVSIECDIPKDVDILKKIDEKFLPDIDYNKLINTPDIPDSDTVAGWGFAKQEDVNAAKSKADLANTKADHALEIADGAEQDAYEAKSDSQSALNIAQGKQDQLVSGENVKTINGESILGNGNIEIIADNADYDENDSTKPSYIKNRPFYAESYTYEFDHTYPASETTWTKWSVGEIFLLDYPIGIEDGEEFEVTVSLGSKTITGVCTVGELSYVDAVMMPEYTGKIGFVLNNSNLSLTFVAANGGTVIVKSVGTLYARYTLNSIRIVCTKSKPLEMIHPLDKKFLPDINFDDLKDKPQIPSDEYIEQLIERKVNDMILSVEEVLF